MFFVVAITVLLLSSSFTAATWTHFAELDPALWQAIALGIVLVFAGVIFISFRRDHVLLRVFGIASAVGAGFLNYGLVAAVACWLVFAVDRMFRLDLDMGTVACWLFGAGALVTIAGIVNAGIVRVTRYKVALANLAPSWRGKTVALVTDLHVGNIRGPRFIVEIVDRLNALQPHAVLIAGDMFDGAKVDAERSVAPWKSYRPAGGIYFVTGNHDEFRDSSLELEALRKVGVRVLDDEKVTVDGLQIVGVHDSGAHRAAAYGEILKRANIDRGQACVLIVHQPSHLEVPESAGVSLQVSGHTHRGQFWPWSLIVRRIYGPFAYGLHRRGRMQVCTSSGAGSWGPPMRVGTRSEIVLLTLENE